MRTIHGGVAQALARKEVLDLRYRGDVRVAALSDETWVGLAKDSYLGARDAAFEALRGSGVRVSLAEGGVYLFLDFADVLRGRSLAVLLERAVEEGVLLAPGEAFGEAFKTSARLCYTATPLDRLLEGITRLRRAIAIG